MSRFVKLPGKARRYHDTLLNEDISRREYEKRRNKPLKDDRQRQMRILPLLPERPQSFFDSHKDTHRWFAETFATPEMAPKRRKQTWKWQLGIYCTLINVQTKEVRTNCMGVSAAHQQWWGHMFIYATEEARRSAIWKQTGESDVFGKWKVLSIQSYFLNRLVYLKRTKANYERYESHEAYEQWAKNEAARQTLYRRIGRNTRTRDTEAYEFL